MSVPRTGKDVLELVRKSGLADDATLKAFLQKSGPLPSNPGEAAAQFLLAGILTELQAEFILKGDPTGFRLGKYVLLERLGYATGELLHAHHSINNARRMTIQMWPEKLSKDNFELDRIYRGVRAAAAIDHPHMVRVFDIDAHGMKHFFVLERLEGKQLPAVLEQAGGKFPVGEACGCAIQAAKGLQNAHENKVCHHGINPTNLFVCENGIVKILNIGFAWVQNLIEGKSAGPVEYMSPEQCLDSTYLDHRTDIYSLGAVLYHLVAARSLTVLDKQRAYAMGLPPAHTVCADVPEPLSLIIAKMMAKKVEKRYQSMTEVIEALRPFVEPAAIGDYPEMAAAALGT